MARVSEWSWVRYQVGAIRTNYVGSHMEFLVAAGLTYVCNTVYNEVLYQRAALTENSERK